MGKEHQATHGGPPYPGARAERKGHVKSKVSDANRHHPHELGNDTAVWLVAGTIRPHLTNGANGG